MIILAKLDKLSNADKETQAKIGGEGREGRETDTQTDTQRRRENMSESLCHLSVLQGVVVTTQLLAERTLGLSAQKRPATWAGPEFDHPLPTPLHPRPASCPPAAQRRETQLPAVPAAKVIGSGANKGQWTRKTSTLKSCTKETLKQASWSTESAIIFRHLSINTCLPLLSQQMFAASCPSPSSWVL